MLPGLFFLPIIKRQKIELKLEDSFFFVCLNTCSVFRKLYLYTATHLYQLHSARGRVLQNHFCKCFMFEPNYVWTQEPAYCKLRQCYYKSVLLHTSQNTVQQCQKSSHGKAHARKAEQLTGNNKVLNKVNFIKQILFFWDEQFWLTRNNSIYFECILNSDRLYKNKIIINNWLHTWLSPASQKLSSSENIT